MGENMFEIISVNVFATNMSSFYLGSRGMLQIVLLLSVLRVTTVIKLSVISYFQKVNLSIEQNDGEYQLQRIISPIALLDNNA